MNKVSSDIFHILQNLQGLELLLHVGLKRSSTKGKIDLLAGCNHGNIRTYGPLVGALLIDRWPTGSFFVCDDSIRFNLPTGTGGVAICDSTLLVRQIEEWIEGRNLGGQHRPWASGYWLPEALCGDLATAEILHDTKNIGARISGLLVPYPPALANSIIDLCVDEIRQKVRMLKWLLETNSPIETGLCISDLATSMVRLAFARSRRYLRGFRSLGEQARLLRSPDLSIYELALKLSSRKRVRSLMSRIGRLV